MFFIDIEIPEQAKDAARGFLNLYKCGCIECQLARR
jgi:hypothetical protein